MSESHKAAIRDFFAAIDRAQNMEAIDQLAAVSYVGHFPGAPPMNREAMKGYGNGFFAACPGLHHSAFDMLSFLQQIGAMPGPGASGS